MPPNYMTRKSYERLGAEARRLKEVEIPRVSREKMEAAQQGDLRENAGYDAARDRLNHIHARLEQIGAMLTGAQFIEDLRIPGDIVSIGTRVTLADLDDDRHVEYSILGPADADLERNIISFQSPLARGMVGKKTADEIVVDTPGGRRRFRIISIERYQ